MCSGPPDRLLSSMGMGGAAAASVSSRQHLFLVGEWALRELSAMVLAEADWSSHRLLLCTLSLQEMPREIHSPDEGMRRLRV